MDEFHQPEIAANLPFGEWQQIPMANSSEISERPCDVDPRDKEGLPSANTWGRLLRSGWDGFLARKIKAEKNNWNLTHLKIPLGEPFLWRFFCFRKCKGDNYLQGLIFHPNWGLLETLQTLSLECCINSVPLAATSVLCHLHWACHKNHPLTRTSRCSAEHGWQILCFSACILSTPLARLLHSESNREMMHSML